MKKVAMILTAVAVLFSVSACCGNNKKAAEAEAEATEVVAEEACCGNCEECTECQCENCEECTECENCEAAEATETAE